MKYVQIQVLSLALRYIDMQEWRKALGLKCRIFCSVPSVKRDKKELKHNPGKHSRWSFTSHTCPRVRLLTPGELHTFFTLGGERDKQTEEPHRQSPACLAFSSNNDYSPLAFRQKRFFKKISPAYNLVETLCSLFEGRGLPCSYVTLRAARS